MGAPRKRMRIVPSVVFATAFAGVVPVCVAIGCGGSETSSGGGDAARHDAQDDFIGQGVAACCFDGSGVADAAFRHDGDASEEPEAPLGVAADAFGVADVAFGG